MSRRKDRHIEKTAQTFRETEDGWGAWLEWGQAGGGGRKEECVVLVFPPPYSSSPSSLFPSFLPTHQHQEASKKRRKGEREHG